MKKYSGYFVYAASCTPDGGIFRYRLDGNGILSPEFEKIPLDRPMYFVKEGNTFHTLLLNPEGFGKESGYVTCTFGEKPSEPVSTGGVEACHLCLADGRCYVVNYRNGSVSVIGGKTVVHSRDDFGEMPHPQTNVVFSPDWQRERLNLQSKRQNAPHTHQVLPTPDGKYLLVADLGLDMVAVYNLELVLVSFLNLPARSGIRHLVFGKRCPDGSYLLYGACELDATVACMRYADGKVEYLRSEASRVTRPDNTAAAIRISSSGDELFVSQRGENTVTAFRISDDGSLRWDGQIPCFGERPRDFCLTPDDRFLICANEGDGSLTVLSRQYGKWELSSKQPLPCALCVLAEPDKTE